jgi:hypothetical protein
VDSLLFGLLGSLWLAPSLPFWGMRWSLLEGVVRLRGTERGGAKAEENPQPLYRAVSAPARFFSVTQIGVEVDCLSLRERIGQAGNTAETETGDAADKLFRPILFHHVIEDGPHDAEDAKQE